MTRWTQTDNAASSLVSLDWDNYDCDRLRSVDVCGLNDIDVDVDDVYVDEIRSSASAYHESEETRTLLMASHTASDTTLQASRTSQMSSSSPYVLCFECNEEFSLNNNRRSRRNFFAGLDRNQLSRSSPLAYNNNSSSNNHQSLMSQSQPTVPSRTRRKQPAAPVQDLHK